MANVLAALTAVLYLTGCAQMPSLKLALDQVLNSNRAGAAETPETAAAADAETGPATGSVAQATAEPAPIPAPQEKAKPGQLYQWNGDGRKVTRIIIDTNEQRARFYDGDEQIGWTTIASGIAKYPTPRGEFTILEKVKNKRSNLYGKIVNSKGGVIKGSASSKDRIPAGARFVGASMPHFMRMTYDGIGMHAGPIPRPGSPASHGCIRMPKTLAAALFKQVAPGTAVTVIGNGPDYGNYGERIARQQAEERARRAALAAAAATDGSALDALDAEVRVMKRAQSKTGPGAGAGAAKTESSALGEDRTGNNNASASSRGSGSEPRGGNDSGAARATNPGVDEDASDGPFEATLQGTNTPPIDTTERPATAPPRASSADPTTPGEDNPAPVPQQPQARARAAERDTPAATPPPSSAREPNSAPSNPPSPPRFSPPPPPLRSAAALADGRPPT